MESTHAPEIGETFALQFEPDTSEEEKLGPEAIPVDNSRLITDQMIAGCHIHATVVAVRFCSIVSGSMSGKSCCLIVFRFRFVPYRMRYTSAKVTIMFSSERESDDDDLPKVVAVAPESIDGAISSETVHTTLHGALQIGVNVGPVEVQPASFDMTKETTKSVTGFMKLRGLGCETSRAIFTLEENDIDETGIPDTFAPIVLLEHGGPFIMQFVVKAHVELGGAVRYLIARLLRRSNRDFLPKLVSDGVDVGDLPQGLVIGPMLQFRGTSKLGCFTSTNMRDLTICPFRKKGAMTSHAGC
jgi:hypothetical protein